MKPINIDSNLEANQTVAQYPMNQVVFHDISFDISHLATLPISNEDSADLLDNGFSLVIGQML